MMPEIIIRGAETETQVRLSSELALDLLKSSETVSGSLEMTSIEEGDLDGMEYTVFWSWEGEGRAIIVEWSWA